MSHPDQVIASSKGANVHEPILNNGFNLIVEQQPAAGWSMRLAYVDSTSRHQFVNLEDNPAVNNGIGNTNQRRVYNTAPVVGPCLPSTGCDTPTRRSSRPR